MANREQHARHLPGRYRSRYVNVPQPQPNTRQNRPETTGDYCADSQRGKKPQKPPKNSFPPRRYFGSNKRPSGGSLIGSSRLEAFNGRRIPCSGHVPSLPLRLLVVNDKGQLIEHNSKHKPSQRRANRSTIMKALTNAPLYVCRATFRDENEQDF